MIPSALPDGGRESRTGAVHKRPCESGTRWRLRTGRTAYSAKTPSRPRMPNTLRFRQWFGSLATQREQQSQATLISPTTRRPSNFGGPSTTCPTNSCPRTPRNGAYPRTSWRSVAQMPARRTRISASPGLGQGLGRSLRSCTSPSQIQRPRMTLWSDAISWAGTTPEYTVLGGSHPLCEGLEQQAVLTREFT